MARPLDIRITKITPTEVHYDLTFNGDPRGWRVPKGSSFDVNTLTVGKRYAVDTFDTMVKGRRVYDWATATEIKSRAAQAVEKAHPVSVVAAMAACGYNDELFTTSPEPSPAARIAPVSTLRAEVEALLEEVAGQPMSAEMQALLFLFAAELDNNPTAFGGAA